MPSQPFNLSERQLDAIDKCLSDLLWETEARCALLSGAGGQLISAMGDFQQINIAVLSALAAGEIAATKEMADLVGERARFRMVLHEGQNNSVYLSDVGEEMFLLTVFETHIPIGMVRLFTKEVVDKLLMLLQSPCSDRLRNDAALGQLDDLDCLFDGLDAVLSESE